MAKEKDTNKKNKKLINEIEKKCNRPKDYLFNIIEERMGGCESFLRECRIAAIVSDSMFSGLIMIIESPIDDEKKEMLLNDTLNLLDFMHAQLEVSSKINYIELINNHKWNEVKEALYQIKFIADNIYIPIVVETLYRPSVEWNKDDYLDILDSIMLFTETGSIDNQNIILERLWNLKLPEELQEATKQYAAYCFMGKFNDALETKQIIRDTLLYL